jgi:very-short-patch-repair endonuclease
VAELGCPENPSPLVGEGGARAAQRRGRVRGNADGLTKRQLLPATTVHRSRELRRTAGPVELFLKAELRRVFPQARFRHQVPFGRYHADFASHAAKLIIEADDATHAERRAQDTVRTRFLNAEGYRVIRFWNNEVMTNIEGVLAAIARTLPPELRGSFA